MFRFISLLVKRLIIFLIVLGLAYFTLFLLFPYIDDRLPTLLAIIVTYTLMAYVGIPFVIRIFRLFDKPRHVPICSTTSDGWASDPVNIAVMANSKKDFVWAMHKAGWHTADKIGIKSACRMVWAIVFDRPYINAPFSSLYLFGRKQDIGFQIPVGNSPRMRHHVRFWRVTHSSLMNPENGHEHEAFWRKLFKRFWKSEQQLWVGSAIYDSGPIAIKWSNGQLTHEVEPDADVERDFIIKSLEDIGVLKGVSDIKAGDPYRGRGQSFGVTIISDGFVKLCHIKRQILSPKHSKIIKSSDKK